MGRTYFKFSTPTCCKEKRKEINFTSLLYASHCTKKLKALHPFGNFAKETLPLEVEKLFFSAFFIKCACLFFKMTRDIFSF
jgi:hypothetical protein